MVACGVKLFLFDFDEFHGFVEVVEDVHAFLCDLVALKLMNRLLLWSESFRG
jgi:hypothetical protein